MAVVVPGKWNQVKGKAQTDTSSSDNYYLVTPASGTGPGVIVLHAWWGLNPFLKNLGQRLAQQGFVALDPDLYHGVTASTVEEAQSLRSTLKRDMVSAEIAQAVEYLRAQPSVRGHDIGVIGFSLGAYWALWRADQKFSAIRATVVFYGTRHGDYTETPSAFLGHFAEHDDWVATSSVKKLEKTLRKAGKEVAFYVYPGTRHWFFEQDRLDAYDAQAAKLAWERTVEFLRHHLYA